MRKGFLSMALVICLFFTLFPAVAQAVPEILVDGTSYTLDTAGLQDAIDEAADGDTVKLEGDIDLGTTGVTVTNKTIILDLNDQTITYSGTAAAVTLSGTANLTVKDSGTRGTITSASDCRILKNTGSGTLTLDSGTIEGTGKSFGISNQGTGFVNITGGTVTTTNMYALLIYGDAGDVTISGGTINATGWGVINHMGNTAKLTISGNTLIYCIGTDASGRCFSLDKQTASLAIQGGRIIGDKGMTVRGPVEISGGYIEPTIYTFNNTTVTGGFLERGIYLNSESATCSVNGGNITSITKSISSIEPVKNAAGDLLKKYSVQLRDADNITSKNTAVTSLSTDPALGYAYGLNDVQTNASGYLYVWLPEDITWFSVTAEGSTYSGAVTLTSGNYQGTLRLASQNPAADVNTVAKTISSQASVDFTLTTAPTGTWKVYDSETATNVMTGVSVSLSGTTLTLTASAGSIQAGDYYVTVTEPNKNESARLKLTVEEAPPILNAATPVITNNLSTAQVEYNQNTAATPLTVTAESTDGGTITYAWYSNTINSTDGATALGVNTPSYTPSTATVGTTYYFCVVTNTNNAVTGTKTAQTTSNIACIKVNAAGGGSNGSGGGGSSSVSTDTPVIAVSEVRTKLFSNAEDIKVEADVKSAFGQSVIVKFTDNADSQKEIFALAGANDKVYPFDISLYSKQSGKKVQPKDGYIV